MRKKSHISLARYIVESMGLEELQEYRKAFYVGSILPDCKPSFLTKRHEIKGTFEDVRKYVLDLTTLYDVYKRNTRVYFLNLGQVIHYIADYFTFPHNDIYTGNIKDHCIYEKELKRELEAYLDSDEPEKMRKNIERFKTPELLFEYILKIHEEYLKVKNTIAADCRYIVKVCYTVVTAVVYLVNERLEQHFQPAFV